MALQRQIWSTFVTVLWCSKTEITDETEILVFVWGLWEMTSKFTDNFSAVHFLKKKKKKTWNQLQFLSYWNNMEKNVVFSLFATYVNDNMTFAYISLFQCIK